MKFENIHSENWPFSKMLHRKIWLPYIFCNWDEVLLHWCEASWEQPHHEILVFGGVLILGRGIHRYIETSGSRISAVSCGHLKLEWRSKITTPLLLLNTKHLFLKLQDDPYHTIEIKVFTFLNWFLRTPWKDKLHYLAFFAWLGRNAKCYNFLQDGNSVF